MTMCSTFKDNEIYARVRVTKARNMADTTQPREKMEKYVSSPVHLANNTRTGESRTPKRLSTKVWKKLSLSELPSFMKGIKLFQHTILSSSYSTILFNPIQNFY